VFSADRDPADRWFDRLLAKLGLLEDAAPLFRDGERVPRAGVLLALPAIAHSGIVEIAREVYGSIGPAFYGLRTPMVALVFLALLRIQRPEVLKEHAPPELGRLLGLDRAPEVKTLRRKLARLAALGRSTELGRQLAARRVQRFTDATGFLYVDGQCAHTTASESCPSRTSPACGSRCRRPPTTGSTTSPASRCSWSPPRANAGLVKMLPALCSDIRALVATAA